MAEHESLESSTMSATQKQHSATHYQSERRGLGNFHQRYCRQMCTERILELDRQVAAARCRKGVIQHFPVRRNARIHDGLAMVYIARSANFPSRSVRIIICDGIVSDTIDD